MQWADRIGRRIKLRDLHVLLAVAEARSISRAAELLAISHPVVSRTISELEQTLGARLFDRSSQGVNLTMHGQAFLDCGVAVFDDLRSGVQRLEFLFDPASGEVRIGSYDIMMAGFIPTIIDQLACKHRKMTFHSIQGEYPYLRTLLRERKVDAIVSRRAEVTAEVDLTTEVLFRDPLLVVAGPRSRSQWQPVTRMTRPPLRRDCAAARQAAYPHGGAYCVKRALQRCREAKHVLSQLDLRVLFGRGADGGNGQCAGG
jgi:DNA-binding transcriptional LysR family regulator